MENNTLTLNAALAQNLGIDPKEVAELHQAFASAIKECASQLDSISLPGFGSIITQRHPEHIECESNGVRVLVPPSVSLIFRPSVVLRKRLSK